MKKLFHVGGFFFNPRTHKVLLFRELPSAGVDSPWHFFGEMSRRGETPEKAFQRIMLKATKVRIPLSTITYLYDYVVEEENTKYVTLFIEKGDLKHEPKLDKTMEYDWHSLSDLTRANLTERTHQDLVFFEREIRAKKAHLPTASL